MIRIYGFSPGDSSLELRNDIPGETMLHADVVLIYAVGCEWAADGSQIRSSVDTEKQT